MNDVFVFGVDIDGVCADYTARFRQVVAADRGVPVDDLPLARSWSFAEWGLDTAEFERLHYEAVTQHRIFRDMPAIDGCADALWRLSDAGVWIRIITHRLYVNWGHATVVSDTVTWLDHARVPYRDICFLGNKPDVGADVYVDDAPHNIDGLRSAGNTAIVFEQPYNRHLDGPRAADWGEVEEIVMELYAQRFPVQPQFPGFPTGAEAAGPPPGRRHRVMVTAR